MKKEWENEPDRHVWEYRGFKCMWKRHSAFGHLCGYVCLPSGHKYYGKHYDDIPIDVHGGLTYSAAKDGYWVIGFDCLHPGDYAPYAPVNIWERGIYRNRKYVENEVERMVDQLVGAEK